MQFPSVPGLVCQLSPPTNIFLQYKHSNEMRKSGETTILAQGHVPRVVDRLRGASGGILVVHGGLARTSAGALRLRSNGGGGTAPRLARCTTDYRHETDAAAHPATQRDSTPPLPPSAAHGPHRFIHGRTQLFIGLGHAAAPSATT